MACLTCDNTMQNIGRMNLGPSVFWCPRCGTLKTGDTSEPPKLVGKVIEFAGHLTDEHAGLIDQFERLGIRESITTIPPG